MKLPSPQQVEVMRALKVAPQHAYALSKNTKIPMGSVYMQLQRMTVSGMVIAIPVNRHKIANRYELSEIGKRILAVLEEVEIMQSNSGGRKNVLQSARGKKG